MNKLMLKILGGCGVFLTVLVLSSPLQAQGPRGGGHGGGPSRGGGMNGGTTHGGGPSRGGGMSGGAVHGGGPSRGGGMSGGAAHGGGPSRGGGMSGGAAHGRESAAPGRTPGGRDFGGPGRDTGRNPGYTHGGMREPGSGAGRIDGNPSRDPGRNAGRDSRTAPGRDLNRDNNRDFNHDFRPDSRRDFGRGSEHDSGRNPGTVPGRGPVVHPGGPEGPGGRGGHDAFPPGRPGRPGEFAGPGGHGHPMAPPPHPISAPVYHPHHEHYMPYYYDPVHFHHGWYPDYRPVYPWWIDAAHFGAGYALGYYMAGGQPVYYYYPSTVVAAGSSGIVYIDETPYYSDETQYSAENAYPDTENPGVDESILEDADPITEAIPAQNSILVNEPQTTELPQITKAEVDAAWKSIQEGDTLFAAGDIASAVGKYAGVTSDLGFMPDAWFRLAYAESARGNYELAQDYCMKGMNASKMWPSSPFSLDYMYQSAAERKAQNLQTLETAAAAAPGNGGLNLLAGLSFYSDGQEAKAAKYLKIAENILPELQEFVEPMLKNIP